MSRPFLLTPEQPAPPYPAQLQPGPVFRARAFSSHIEDDRWRDQPELQHTLGSRSDLQSINPPLVSLRGGGKDSIQSELGTFYTPSNLYRSITKWLGRALLVAALLWIFVRLALYLGA